MAFLPAPYTQNSLPDCSLISRVSAQKTPNYNTDREILASSPVRWIQANVVIFCLHPPGTHP